jgi:YaiO family outer membrane protein
MKKRIELILMVLAVLTAFPVFAALALDQDWDSRVRALVSSNDLGRAMNLVDKWIEAYPRDLDAHAWHARIQAWTRHWSEAEAEYRVLLQQAPDEPDILAGLADLLTWQMRFREALPLLDRACTLAPKRMDCLLRLARVQQNLGMAREARFNYQTILTQDKDSREARAGLEEMRENKRHEVRAGLDSDLFNYAQNAGGVSLSLYSRWNQQWSTSTSLSQFKRFGQNATRFDADATLRLASKNAITVGGAVSHDSGVIPKSEVRIAYDRGFDISETGPIRGIEFMVQQRWAFYEGVRLQVLSPGVVIYCPNDWNWLIQFSTVQSSFSASETTRKPGGWTRLTIPLSKKLTGHVLFSVGAENYSTIDQIHQLSAKTWGGGIRIALTPGQELTGSAHYQRRSGGQAVTSLGMIYAFRF